MREYGFHNWKMGFNYNSKLMDLGFTKLTSNNMTKPLCSNCKREMQFKEGDMIFGEKWYHKGCRELAVEF